MRIAVILNPVAGAGRAASLWPEFAAELERQLGQFTLLKTTQPNDAMQMAEELAADGYELVIAAGGDGTIGEAADGLLKAGKTGAALPCLAILPCGTGSDLSRTLGINGAPASLVGRIDAGNTRLIDAGRVSYVDDEGRAALRYFINIASLGLSGPTSRAVNRAKRLGGTSGQLVFMWHTVRELIRYRFQDVTITVDDAASFEARIAVVAAANGKYFGGGMMIAPDADLEDGLLDLVIFRGAAKLSLIRDLRLLYSGSHVNHPAVTILRGRRIVIEPVGGLASNVALIDIDGESPGSIPAAFEVVPKALRIVC